MPTLTNDLSLPEAIVRAVANDDYSRGDSDRTVTELIDPPRKVVLLRRHADALTEDVSTRIWSLLGQAVHSIMERAEQNALAEERLYTTRLGWRIGGKFDHLALLQLADDTYGLDDYKVTSAWAIKDGAKPEWEAQLNLLALLLREHGFAVARLRAIVILRDWRKNEALRYPDYPQRQVVTVPVRLWCADEQEEYLWWAIGCHQDAEKKLPLCTPEERWQRAPVWALMKVGRKSAVKLYDTAEAAETAAADDAKLSVQYRPGIAVRCTQYCAALPFCRAQGDGQFAPGDLGDVEEE